MMTAVACTCGPSPSTSLNSFTSREISEISHELTLRSSSSARVVAPSNMSKAVIAASQKASVSCSLESRVSSSSFWGKDGNSRLLNVDPNQQAQILRSSRPMPPVEARLFGPAIFEASKLRVLFLGKEDDKGQLQNPRIYTLTHSDVTAKITLAVAQEINKAQLMGWYNQLQRDEVLAEWRRTKGEMSLHVHCHISGGNWLHNLIAKLRFYIFRKELPVVLESFVYGDKDLFSKHPELKDAPVWVYFHSNMEEYNRLECWGPLSEATKGASELQKEAIHQALDEIVSERKQQFPKPICSAPCECCSRHDAVIPIPDSFRVLLQARELEVDVKRETTV
ncbi:hypothetical protein R1flu_020165 [Riccia fluitans]|uniref:Staygreen protein domain-containing protein n=1 Tax=Riccia fluitans TaxID=41844 RepID=A0ABD1ZKQ5_9MARC